MEVKQIGNLWGENTEFDNKTSGRVYDKNGISPTLNTMQGGWKQPMIIDESKLIPCKLDKMPEGHLTSLDNAKICDIGTETASTVTARYYKGIGAHKDNMCIVAMRGRNPNNPSDRTVGSPTEQRLEPNSQGICNTLTSVQKDNLVMEREIVIAKNGDKWSAAVLEPQAMSRQYRIRKLTPLECWRLMDFTDEDFEKAAQVNSNTQLYKQAGNSIIRNVLVAILGQLIEGKEDAYRKV